MTSATDDMSATDDTFATDDTSATDDMSATDDIFASTGYLCKIFEKKRCMLVSGVPLILFLFVQSG